MRLFHAVGVPRPSYAVEERLMLMKNIFALRCHLILILLVY